MTRRLLALLVFAAGSLPVVAQSPPQSPAFSSRVEVIRVDVLVTDDGKPVTGLTAADFELTDNGVRQKVDLVLHEQLPLNVVLTFDMSGSVSGNRLDQLQRAAGALMVGLEPEDRAGLVTFSEVVTERSPLSSDREHVRDSLAASSARGGTALVDGVYAGMMLGESDAGRSLMVVFSDGLDTLSWLTPESVLEIGKRSDVVVYTVATGRSRRSEFLRQISGATAGRAFELESTKNLDATFLAILEEFRHRYVVSYSPRDVSRGGWHRLEVRVPRRGVSVKARPGYLGGS